MTPHDKNKSPDLDYKQAEKMINQSIAKMEDKTHIEYNGSINRNEKKSWHPLHRFLHMLGIT